jgi:hypothetical protein
MKEKVLHAKAMMHNKLISLMLILVTASIGILAVFYNINIWNGIDLDEFYHALNVRDYKNSPLGLLTFYEGYVFQSIFGESLLNIRFLAQSNVLATVLLGVGYYWYCTRDRLFTTILLFVCSVSAPICFVIIYDWYTASFPFVILSLIMLLEYLKGRTGRKSVIYIGIVQALMVQTRLPMIFVVPITIILFFSDSKISKSQSLKNVIIYLASGLITTILLYFVILGSPSNWLDAWKSKNILSGHGDLMVYIKNLSYVKWNLPQASALLVALLISPYILKLKSLLSRAIAFVLSAFFLVGYDLLVWGRGMDIPCNGYYYFAAIAIIVIAYYINQKKRKKTLEITTVVIFSLLPAVGSDVMVLRPIWLFILPVLLLYLTRLRQILLTWMLLSGIVVFMSFCYTTYRIRSCRTDVVNIVKIDGMRQTHEHAEWVQDMIRDVTTNIPNINDAITVGQGKYMMDYLLGDGVGYHNSFFHYQNFDGKESVDSLMFQEMAMKDYIILSAIWWGSVDEYPLNQTAIKSAGFEEILSKPFYIIYRRKNKQLCQ